jgi:DNA polymerase-3 subunit alpha
MMALAQRSAETASSGIEDMFGGVAAADVSLRIPLYEPWPASVRLQKEYAAVGFFLSGHPLDEFGPVLDRLRVQKWVDFCRSVRSGASVGRVAATVLDRYERRTKTGNKMGIVMLSDQTGHFEAIVFSEGLQRFRDLLEPGCALVLVLQAGMEGDEVRARIQSAESLDEAVRRHHKGMRIFVRDEAPFASVESRLRERGEGEVSLVLILDSGEIEVKLPGRYQLTPQIAGALRAAPGVVHVEMS